MLNYNYLIHTYTLMYSVEYIQPKCTQTTNIFSCEYSSISSNYYAIGVPNYDYII